MNTLKSSLRSLFEDRILLERELAKLELTASTADQALKETESWSVNHRKGMEKVLDNIESLETVVHEKTNPLDLRPQLAEIKASYDVLEDSWIQRFNIRNASLKKSVESSNEQLKNLGLQVSDIKSKADSLDHEIETITNDMVDSKINLALLNFQRESLTKTMKRLDKDLQQALEDLARVCEAGLRRWGKDLYP